MKTLTPRRCMRRNACWRSSRLLQRLARVPETNADSSALASSKQSEYCAGGDLSGANRSHMEQIVRKSQTSRELSELRNDLDDIEKRIDAVRELIRTAEAESFRQNDQSVVLREDVLVARIVDGVFSRLATTPKDGNDERKPYLREKEAALYMGVSVFALRSWRSKR